MNVNLAAKVSKNTLKYVEFIYVHRWMTINTSDYDVSVV